MVLLLPGSDPSATFGSILVLTTPFEAWSGHNPNVTHFRIFGSRSWARIPTEKRKALQPQSQECLFVGYSEDSKGCNIINLITNKDLIERSVQFQEEPLAAVEVGESSSPPEPLNVSEETNEFSDSDMSDNDDLISYPNIPIRQKLDLLMSKVANYGLIILTHCC